MALSSDFCKISESSTRVRFYNLLKQILVSVCSFSWCVHHQVKQGGSEWAWDERSASRGPNSAPSTYVWRLTAARNSGSPRSTGIHTSTIIKQSPLPGVSFVFSVSAVIRHSLTQSSRGSWEGEEGEKTVAHRTQGSNQPPAFAE